ncbi:MAG: polysaccharide deacetylase family protein [Anaerolineales bacterium]|nr:polysaccharide deacetylase family protein [Anaerolineales bacterium]
MSTIVSKTAYLTIDDAPSADFERKTAYLLEQGIPAIFFCGGKELQAWPEMVVRAIQQGFVIGNHAAEHTRFSTLSLETCYDLIQRTDAQIEALYAQAGVARPAKYFRFPYGDKGGLVGDDPFIAPVGEGLERKEALQAHLRRLGYTQPDFPGITYNYYRQAGLLDDVDWYWTYDVLEWAVYAAEHKFGIDSLAAILARMDEHEPEGGRGLNTPGSDEIILTHDHVENTTIFPAIIQGLLAKGLRFSLP